MATHHRLLADQHDIINEKYKIVERIGRGAFGMVYLVEDITTHIQFALKQIFADDATINASLRTSWLVRPLMHHPEILEVLDVFIQTGMRPISHF